MVLSFVLLRPCVLKGLGINFEMKGNLGAKRGSSVSNVLAIALGIFKDFGRDFKWTLLILN